MAITLCSELLYKDTQVANLADDNGTQAFALNGTRHALSQSWGSGGSPGEVTAACALVWATGSPAGQLQALIYAHSGTFGTSSVPTGAPLATSDTINDMGDIGVGWANRDLLGFQFTDGFTPQASTNYVLVFDAVDETSMDGSNLINMGIILSGPTAGNTADLNGSWTASSSIDMIFDLYYGVAPATAGGQLVMGRGLVG